MVKNESLYGVVVLFNPEATLLENIKTYINSLENLFLIDNSDRPISHTLLEELKSIPRCIYINNANNLGIAYALNLGAKMAIKEGASWLLTMDQDSQFIKGPECLINYLREHNSEEIGLIAPFHTNKRDLVPVGAEEMTAITSTMTSGTIINLKAFLKVKGFTEELFIDYVDHDYCLRLILHKYKNFQYNASILKHHLGKITIHNWFGRKIMTTNHSSSRRYFITRNRFYLWRKYQKDFPRFVRGDRIAFIKECIKILIFEKNKKEKIISILRGIKNSKDF